MRYTLHPGDCLEVLATLEPNSVDAVVTDPPYGLAFMGREWDHAVPGPEFFRAMLRVAKPGANLFAFGAPRLFHRMSCAIEDAGWELRDTLAWMFGEGFPKSLAIDKAIDRRRDDREQTYRVTAWIREARDRAGISNSDIDAAFGFFGMAGHWTSNKSQPAVPRLEYVPKLLEVLRVDDFPPEIGALVLELNGRKGTPGESWAQRAVIGTRTGVDTTEQTIAAPRAAQGIAETTRKTFDVTEPASELAKRFKGYGTTLKPGWEPIVLAMKPLDGKFSDNAERWGVSGLNIDGGRFGPELERAGGGGRWPANVVLDPVAAEELERAAAVAGVSRFFYTAKAGAADRTDGNTHPTVKPTDLMQWLVRLAKPPGGGVILDPFMGSGSTGVACVLEGVDFVGIEREAEFLEIAGARIKRAHRLGREVVKGRDGSTMVQHGLFEG